MPHKELQLGKYRLEIISEEMKQSINFDYPFGRMRIVFMSFQPQPIICPKFVDRLTK
jgi:hypothetical protein